MELDSYGLVKYVFSKLLDSGLMEFTPGINIIVGRNNAGKTSLLELLTLKFENQPHKSLKTLPTKSSLIKEGSKIELSVLIEKQELRTFLKHIQSQIGILDPGREFDDQESEIQYYMDLRRQDDSDWLDEKNNLIFDAFNRFKNFLDNDQPVEIELLLLNNFTLENSTLAALSTFKLYPSAAPNEKNKYNFYKIQYDSNEELILECDAESPLGSIPYSADIKESIGFRLFESFVKKIYQFKAERLNIGSCKLENNSELKSDISNLAEVLCVLQGKQPGMFAKFNELVSIILPEIKWISVVHKEDYVEILVWNLDAKLNRDDLSLSLSSCGSGVGQVLAILYILVSSEEPRTLIIDEPQSFLHPGAARKLMEIIKQFPQHQYFIATHSPEIITAANPSNIIKLQYQDCETTASVINATEIESQKEILSELGVRLSDVFGADNILWVEGQTEEKCFPLILEKIAGIPMMGIKILPVGEPSAFCNSKKSKRSDAKQSERIVKIYKKLSSGAGLFPTAIAFIFDRDHKEEDEIKKLEEIGLKFLKRPMYENYLLNPEAISAIVNEEAQKELAQLGDDNAVPKWLNSPITSIQVEECFDKIKQTKQCLLKNVKEEDVLDHDWFLNFHGANFIDSVFKRLSGDHLKFCENKPTYSLRITEWLIKNQPDFLSELSEELKICFNKGK
ncbi:MAG TPA: AAA family ATPase [Nodularia sp. (in: cyanobacteria)]|nr:AAA family ATPase [Nodularia sp. (in: cyanobacteria)]